MKLRKGQRQTFNGLADDEISALETLKVKLVEPPVLALSRSQRAYTVDTDVCDKQIGCVLLQKQPERTDEPLGYWSRLLYEANCTYHTTHRQGPPLV